MSPPTNPSSQNEPARPRPAGRRSGSPNLVTKAWNVVSAVSAFVTDGLKLVSVEQYRQRLDICDPCDERAGNRCQKCGCHLMAKAAGRAFTCPLGKWPSIPS